MQHPEFNGRIQLSRSSRDTVIHLAVSGLSPDTRYPAHIHAMRCEHNQGGGHYKIDPFIDSTIESNELWPAFTTDSEGSAMTRIASKHLARGDALSVVIHQDDGSKLACANLERKPTRRNVLRGEILTMPHALNRDIELQGHGVIKRFGNGNTEMRVNLRRLAPERHYLASAHTMPCATGGGTQYRLDPAQAASEGNTLSLMLKSDMDGKAQSQLTREGHIARPEAQSIVIMDVERDERIACVDLSETLH